MPIWVPGRGNREWGSEVGTEWDLGTEEKESPPSSCSFSEETEVAVIRMRCARNPEFCEAYATRVSDLSPPRTYAWARARAQNNAYPNLIFKVETPYAPPGRGDRQKLPRFSLFQRYIQRKVAMEYGYDYPYAPLEIMKGIEGKREALV